MQEGFTCTTNTVAAAGNVLCVATSDKAKIAFISESQSYKVSVPEVVGKSWLDRPLVYRSQHWHFPEMVKCFTLAQILGDSTSGRLVNAEGYVPQSSPAENRDVSAEQDCLLQRHHGCKG